MKHTSNRISQYAIQSHIEFNQRDWMEPTFCDLVESCDSAYVAIAGGVLTLHCDGFEFVAVLGDESTIQSALQDISSTFYLVEKSYFKAAILSQWMRRCFYARDVVDGSGIDE